MTDNEYFSSYEDVEIHKLMLDDIPRTNAYKNAISNNAHLFKDKIVMDIGAGSGILSLFAMKAGAKRVYAIEASGMAQPLKKIIDLNDSKGIINVIAGKAEEIKLPNNEKVDIIISEWMGFYLLHESMLNSVIKARDIHLEPNDGIMFPSHSSIYAAPCAIDNLITNRKKYWSDVYGFDMSPMADMNSSKPDIRVVESSDLLAEKSLVSELDLRWVTEEEVIALNQRTFISISKDGTFGGLLVWFDVHFAPNLYNEFADSLQPVTLSTGPDSVPTHWKQTLIILPPTPVEKNEIVGWSLNLSQCSSNPRQYAIQLEILDPSTEEHPVPCDCEMAKCALVKALMLKEEQDMSIS